MNNAIFGKTMENMRNHIDVKLHNRMHDAQKQWSRSWIFVAEVFSGNQIAIEIRKFELKFNKP